jgi:GT2 family glycosyltransferase
MKTNKAAIIIVNWNGKRFLKDCLTAVFRQTYKDFQVYFVDNGSTDESSDYVRKAFPKAKIIQLDKNYGFAGGNNAGIKECFKNKEVRYIICLNNDTIVDKNWLKALVQTVEKDEKIGMISSKAYFTDGKIQNAGFNYEKALQINKQGGISIGYGLTDEESPQLNKEIEIFAAGGVGPLYRRDILESLYKRDKEIFDEDFFAYSEDLDLGFRIRKMGYKCFLSPKAKLIHLHSQTSKAASPFKAYYCERNTILTAAKNLSGLDLFLFPFRNIQLKISYLFDKNDSVEKLKENIGFLGLVWILIKANTSALFLMPKMLIKRWKMGRNIQ